MKPRLRYCWVCGHSDPVDDYHVCVRRRTEGELIGLGLAYLRCQGLWQTK